MQAGDPEPKADKSSKLKGDIKVLLTEFYSQEGGNRLSAFALNGLLLEIDRKVNEAFAPDTEKKSA